MAVGNVADAFGAGAGVFAVIASGGPVLAGALGVDHNMVAYLAITAVMWGVVGAYHLW